MVAYKGLLKIFLKQINLQNKVFSNSRGFSQDFFLEFQLTDNHNSPINSKHTLFRIEQVGFTKERISVMNPALKPAANLTKIGVFGTDRHPLDRKHGCGLWDAGVTACLKASDADPILIPANTKGKWKEKLSGVEGVVISGFDNLEALPDEVLELATYCRQNDFPVLGIDHGMHALNNAFGGTTFEDLCRQLPEALQHKHPPERGLRHAILVQPDCRLANIYGEGEIVVNSEHRRGIQKLARGFKITATALDGVVEGIESISEDWYAVGVQWHPGSGTASGLDIQVFRGLVDAARERSAAKVMVRLAA